MNEHNSDAHIQTCTACYLAYDIDLLVYCEECLSAYCLNCYQFHHCGEGVNQSASPSPSN